MQCFLYPTSVFVGVCDNHKRSKQCKMDLHWIGFLDKLLSYSYDPAHHESQPACRLDLLGVNVRVHSLGHGRAGQRDRNPASFPKRRGANPAIGCQHPTNAQIFYAANIIGSGVGHNDTVTVTFTCVSSCTSPSITAGGIVAVEYSGLDTMYPLHRRTDDQ
jgi:hypothetical protein